MRGVRQLEILVAEILLDSPEKQKRAVIVQDGTRIHPVPALYRRAKVRIRRCGCGEQFVDPTYRLTKVYCSPSCQVAGWRSRKSSRWRAGRNAERRQRYREQKRLLVVRRQQAIERQQPPLTIQRQGGSLSAAGRMRLGNERQAL